MLHWADRNGYGSVCGIAEYCYCLWGCPDLFCNPPFIMHSANIRWGPALLVKASCKLQEFVQLMGPGSSTDWTRGASDVLDGATVLPSRKLKWILVIGRGLGASWTSLLCSGNQKCPSSSLETFYCHILFQTVLSRLRGWKSDLQSLFIRIWSPAFVWGGCGDFCGWWGGNGHPSKITYHEENRTECTGNRRDSLYEKRNRRAVNKAHLFQINVF